MPISAVRQAGSLLALMSVNVICSLMGLRCEIGERSIVNKTYTLRLLVLVARLSHG